MAFLSKVFGDANERYIRSLQPVAAEIAAFEKEFADLSDEALRILTQEFKKRLTEGDTLDALLPEAFAAARVAAMRTLNKRHFDVQLVGGIVLHQGRIAEMKTGEGKTLVATLPLYLNSLAGRGAHLVTPNDYLSRVGAGWMGPVYHGLGVEVAVIAHDFSGIYDPEFEDPHPHGDPRLNHFRPCGRHEAYAADITYGTNNEFGFDYLRDNLEYDPRVLRQREHTFAIVDEVDSILIDEARTPLIISAPDAESGTLYGTFAKLVPQLKEKDDYNVDEKFKAVTITETGIDKVERLLGVANIYEEKGIRFVRHLESALRAHALFFRDRNYVVKDGAVIIVDEFTGRLMPGRRWSEGLHQAIEAKEGVMVQQESRTLATITFQNYFRMYEKLAGMTGTAQTSAEEFHKVYGLDVITVPTHRSMIREDRGDLIFRSERGKFQAVVREVKALSEKGQPVLIGTVSIERSERLSRMLEVDGVRHSVLNAKNHEQEALIIAQAGQKGAVTVATNMAGRGVDIILGGANLETGFPSKSKKSGNELGNGVSKLGEKHQEVAVLGGLYVIGTERHEARRIDNQLRGRAGRQGDPGVSQFFVSLEDDLMRVFGSEKIKRMMEVFGLPEDEAIENRVVSRSIESAQGKIEGLHFDSRKQILEYDDVLSKQRVAVYRQRRDILFAPEAAWLKEQIAEMIGEEVRRIVDFHTQGDEWNLEEIGENIKAITDVSGDILAKLREFAAGQGDSEEKRDAMMAYLGDALKRVYDEREKAAGEEVMREMARATLLRSIDALWMDHLDEMEHLRDSVRLRAYGQRDPLVEYKNEGSRMFRELQAAIRSQVAQTIFKARGHIHSDVPQKVEERRPDVTFGGVVPMIERNRNPILSQINASEGVKKPTAPAIGRNDPCSCGSGKKYKRCHGA